MKKSACQSHRDVEFNIGNLILLRVNLYQYKAMSKTKRHKGLVLRYDSPFQVVAQVLRVTYRLNLPRRLVVLPVFHVSFLKKYTPDLKDEERNVSKQPLPMVRVHFIHKVERILD